jgi:hypothetical protein
MPRFDIDNHAPETIIPVSGPTDARRGRSGPIAQNGVNPHVGPAQSHEGHDLQDP